MQSKKEQDISFDGTMPVVRMKHLTPRERVTLEQTAEYWSLRPDAHSVVIAYGNKYYPVACVQEIKPRWADTMQPYLTLEHGPVSAFVAAHISEMKLDDVPMPYALARMTHDLTAVALQPIISTILDMPPRKITLATIAQEGTCDKITGDIRLGVPAERYRPAMRVERLVRALLHELYHSALDRQEKAKPAHDWLPGVHFAEVFAIRAYEEAPAFVERYVPAMRAFEVLGKKLCETRNSYTFTLYPASGDVK